jgi:hypothetical protein
MPLSVQPLTIGYSFVTNRRQATDRVDLAELAAAFEAVTDKLNEIITALDVTTGDDNTLADDVIEGRHLSEDALEEITGMIREELEAEDE